MGKLGQIQDITLGYSSEAQKTEEFVEVCQKGQLEVNP